MATRLQKKLAGEASEYQGDSSDSEQTPETRETLKYKIELRTLELEDKQREREDKQREREWEEKRWEQEKELKIMQLEKDKEIELRRLELEKEKLALSQPHIINQEGNGRTEASDLLLKRFPKFNKDDDVEKFLISFERCCRDFEIDEGKWMLYLRPQICGKLLEIYGDVPEESHRDYNFFKKQVQQKLQLTPEFYRLKFRSLRKEKHQSFAQVASKQAQLFDSWLRTSEVENFQQLRELIKLEQLFQLVPSDYRWLVQDRKPSTADKAASMTDQLITLREGFRKDEGLSERRQNKPPFYNYQTHTQYKKTPAVENTAYRRPEVINQTKPEVKARCYQCGKSDHLKYQCPLLRRDKTSFFMNKEPKENTVNSDIKLLSNTEKVPREKQCLFILSDEFSEDYLEPITIVNQQKQGWRDTGSQVCVIHPKSVPQKYQKPTSEINLKGLGPAVPAEVVSLPIEYNGWKGIWDVAISSDIPHECLIGNDLARQVKNWKKLCEEKENYNRSPIQEAVCLPIQPESEQGPESSSAIIEIVSKTGGAQEIKQAPEEDESLKPLFKQAESLPDSAEELPNKFVTKDGVLYRESKSVKSEDRSGVHSQIVVPEKFRNQIMGVAHDNPHGGHLGTRKTTKRIARNFYWPGMFQSIKKFCQSCNTCQRLSSGRDKVKAPLIPVPVIEEPFYRVGIDIIGPLCKPSRRGYRYILTMIDYAMRYPEAVALTNIETTTIANALLSIWGRTGYPKELISDLGTQFTSRLMKKLLELCGIRHITSTAYHPQTNGLVENLNKTLVKMIKSYSQERPHDWDIELQQLLFAYRSVPQDSMGYSPFELLYGRKARGPLDLVKEYWEARPAADAVPVAEYLTDLQSTMRVARDIAHEHLAVAQQRQKSYYDISAKPRFFSVGDEVLFLSPTKTNKLQMDWTGPWKVTKRLNQVNYDILDEQLNIGKRVHVNMLKPYIGRSANVCFMISEESVPFSFWEGDRTLCKNLDQVEINSDLAQSQQKELIGVLNKYKDMFSDLPGRVQGVEHQINTGDATPIASPPYRVTGRFNECIDREVREMLDLGIIVPSSSPWASPVVLVQKPDKTIRFCVDYRLLNKVTQTDTYPMPRLDDLLERIGNSKFISSIDLTKGFWQVPMAPQDQQKTAFRTQGGLHEFTVLPFGLKNSPATFQRLVDKVLSGLGSFCVAYIDDIGIFSNSWEDHLKHLDLVLKRLKEAGLTIKASKCKLGNNTTKYLGHLVGGGCIRPDPTKVEAIHNWPIPKTKKQVRSFLGLAGYYRKFIPSFSDLAAPLSDLTKKKNPNQIIWTPNCQSAMDKLKKAITSNSVLKAPDFEIPFILTCDASDAGLGAVLSQKDPEGEDRPILFLSKKWHTHEYSMSTIEKECFSIIWSIKKLKPYLWGRKFILQTDHAPLKWLDNVKGTNNKLLRWSLTLQDFVYDIKHITGKKNVVADALSRVT
ncbi:uncharacterized protein LOC103279995 [Anolis carolinensis]|uniref:Gypsy retrotransposon integrase-like protein 1 n=1 Tax=Anolis carolinensis TaxID=28377 RepID=A0A803SPH0_ANOCA